MAETLDRETLKALSTDTRQEIVKMLSKRPYTASEISKLMNKHVTTITEHLDVLEKAGLIHRKDSTNKWIYYTLTDKGQKIFKPAYYTWVITLSLALVIVVAFSLYQAFGTNYSSKALNAGSEYMRSAAESGLEQQVSVGVGEVVQEGGKNYVHIQVTDSNSNPMPIEVDGKITNSGSVPVYIADAAENISIRLHETKTVNDMKVVPLEITSKEKTEVESSQGSTRKEKPTDKVINVNIIDSRGNVNSFPLKIAAATTD